MMNQLSNILMRKYSYYFSIVFGLSLFSPVVADSSINKKLDKILSTICSLKKNCACIDDCCVDTSIAVAQFAEDLRNPVEGKNVLIIGASKGNGNGAAQAFTKAGANVVGTSRAPADYVGQPWLSQVPCDITQDASVQNFFDTDPTLATWDHIDILILSGVTNGSGPLMYMKASDLYPQMNTEFFGRHRVVERAIRLMQNVDNSRIITLSSEASFLPIALIGSYVPMKQALNGWVRQWNAEREWFHQLTGEYTCKTIAIAAQPSWVDTNIGSLPPSLCNPSAPAPYQQYASGLADPFSQSFYAGQFGYLGNSLAQGLTHEEVGMAILYMASVVNPQWQYVVEKDGGEQVCFGEGTISLDCILKQAIQHKCRDAITSAFTGYNWNAAYHNILNQDNSAEYSFYTCPPINASAPLNPVPALAAGFPDCTGGFTPGVPANIVIAANVDDLVNNPCKPANPC